jgi:hypothetical protein
MIHHKSACQSEPALGIHARHLLDRCRLATSLILPVEKEMLCAPSLKGFCAL